MTTIRKPILISLSVIMGGILLSAGESYALSYTSQVRVVNPRFEADRLTNGDFTINTLTGWTAVNNGGNGGIYNPSDTQFVSASSPTSIFTAAQAKTPVDGRHNGI